MNYGIENIPTMTTEELKARARDIADGAQSIARQIPSWSGRSASEARKSVNRMMTAKAAFDNEVYKREHIA